MQILYIVLYSYMNAYITKLLTLVISARLEWGGSVGIKRKRKKWCNVN